MGKLRKSKREYGMESNEQEALVCLAFGKNCQNCQNCHNRRNFKLGTGRVVFQLSILAIMAIMAISTDTFTAGLIQMSCSPDPDENLRRACDKVREAAKQGAQTVCLPELFRTQYFCQREDAALFDLAEPIPGPTTDALAPIAREKKIVIVVSVFERRARGLYHNTAAVIDATGEIVGLYRKMHIPDDPLYYEKYYFTPGDLGFKAFDTAHGRMGTLVCWDQWYPEGARLTALQGANILFYPTAIGWHPDEKQEFGTARRLADHPACARHRQRRVCGRGQPRGPRVRRRPRQPRAGQGPGVLGRVVPVRSLRPYHRGSIAQ
jgi:predicted amidohydrolase